MVDGAIASRSGDFVFDAGTNTALTRLINETEQMNDNELGKEFVDRKNKNITKETSRTALKQRQLDDSKEDRQLRAAAHSDLTTY